MLGKLYITLSLIILIVGGLYTGYNYYLNMKNELENVKIQNTQYKSNLELSDQTIKAMQQQFVRIQEETTKLQKKLKASEEYNNELMNKLNEHDLTRLSAKKPGLIEKRINDATSKIFEELEVITTVPST